MLPAGKADIIQFILQVSLHLHGCPKIHFMLEAAFYIVLRYKHESTNLFCAVPHIAAVAG